MRHWLGLLSAIAAASCGPALPHTTPAVAPPVTIAPPTQPAVQLDPRNTGALPPDAIALVSIDPAKLSSLAATVAGAAHPGQVAFAEHVLALLPGSLLAGNAVESIGVDPSRPITFAFAPLDGAGRELLETIQSKARSHVRAQGVQRTIEKALNVRRSPPIHLRVVIPASEQARLTATLREWASGRRYVPVTAPAEFDSIHARRERAVAISLGPSLVIVDMFAFAGAVPNTRAIVEAASAALLSLKGTQGAAPLPLDGSMVRLTYSPARAAEVGLLETVSRAHDTLGGGPDYELDERMASALRDASSFLQLGGTQAGAWFDRLDLSLELRDGLPALAATASFGPAHPAPPEQDCAPRPSVDFPGALARFDLTTACVDALHLPAPAERHEAGSAEALFGPLRRGGPLAWPAALPFATAAATRVPLQWFAGVGPRAMMRFERFGWANPSFGAPDVFWGLLPAGVRPDQVVCAVSESEKECKPKLKVAALTDLGRGYAARLVKLSGRVVVLASADRAALQALTPVLTAPVPALRGAVSQGTMARILGRAGLRTAPLRYVGDAHLEGRKLHLTIRPAPAP